MKKTVSSLLDKLTDLIIKKPKTIFVVLVVSSIVPMLYLPQLVVDTSPQAFFHQDDPILLKYDQFLDQYERDEVAVLLLEHDNIFSNQFLQVLKNIHQDLESTTPFVEEVASLINTTSIKGRNNELVVKDLLDDWPQSEQAFSDLRQDVLSHPLYPNLLISKDARYTTIVVRSLAFNSETKNSVDELLDGFESTQEESQRTDFKKLDAKQLNKFNESILDLVKKYQTPDTKIYTGGLSLSNHEIIVGLNKEIPLFTGLAILLIALFLYLLFGRISGVVIPITLVCTALLSTLGIMTFFQV
ncbi:MAG: MMPL family transporter, partial [Gammaproteobacteria bacterium]|nr:MMPL family transporter [Gammaproteobacteria bacterium]